MSIQLDINAGVATISLNNPNKHNALTADDLHLFIQHLSKLRAQSECRVLIVTNNGGKTFCAGASLAQLADGTMSGELFSTLTNTLAALTIPTIAALNGNAYGGGAELALCCDFRIGAAAMRLFVPPARFGLCYPINGIERFVNRLGLTTAKRLLIAAEEFNGEQLLSINYLTHLVATNAINSTSRDLAQNIAQLAPLAASTMKQLCDEIASGTLDREQANKLIDVCNSSQDLQEGLAAAREKRQPVFIGQ